MVVGALPALHEVEQPLPALQSQVQPPVSPPGGVSPLPPVPPEPVQAARVSVEVYLKSVKFAVAVSFVPVLLGVHATARK